MLIASAYKGSAFFSPMVGDSLTLRLPRVDVDKAGNYFFDFGTLNEVTLEVVGLLNIVSRRLEWGARFDAPHEDLYWTFEDIYLPISTWETLWGLSSDDKPYRPQQLGLVVDDFGYTENILDILRNEYPNYTFYSTSGQIQRIMRTMSWETKPLRAPKDSYSILDSNQYGDIQDDLRLPIAVSLFFTAALVITSNLLIMVASRKHEIAVLKAVGAKSVQIMIMILSEATLVSCIGGILGFSVTQIPMILNQIVASVGPVRILAGLVTNLLIIVCLGAIVTLLLSILPAQKMMRLTVMDALRDE